MCLIDCGRPKAGVHFGRGRFSLLLSRAIMVLEVSASVKGQREVATYAGSAVRQAATRLPFLDFLRALASQLIVWHHLVFYGPLPVAVYPIAPRLIDWLIDYARMAVQVFFVLGGFFTARSLARAKIMSPQFLIGMIGQRYRRIGVPYLVTLLLAIAANALARRWMNHDAISEPPTVGQLLAHAAFLHDILGYQALTAGIWYLAIDFQLFLLFLLTFAGAQAWLKRRGEASADQVMNLVLKILVPLALASLFWFNRHPRFDAWAIYFVGSYFLGIVLQRVVEQRLKLSLGVSYLALVLVAAVVDPRPRLLVAVSTAVIVFAAERFGILQQWPRNRVVNYFGRISYSLFLIHFPVLLVVNAWGVQRFTTSAGMAALGIGVAYGLSLLAGAALYHGVESRLR